MFRFWEIEPGVFVRRDCVELVRVVNTTSVFVRLISGQTFTLPFGTLAQAEAERDRILNEEL